MMSILLIENLRDNAPMTSRIKIKRFFPKGHGTPSVAELLASDQFQTFINHTISEYENTGKLKDVRYFLNTFADTDYFKGFLLWSCAKLGLTYKWSLLGDDFLLTRHGDPDIQDPSIEEYLAENKGSLSALRREDGRSARDARLQAKRKRKAEERKRHPNMHVKSTSKAFPTNPHRKKWNKKAKGKKKIEVMWRRMPGSFESGKS